MNISKQVVIRFFRGLTRLLCRIDDAQLDRVPTDGPLILIANHTGLLEIPTLYTHLQPRQVSGLVAAVRWRSRLLRWMLDACEAIPVRRGELDVDAMRRALALLGTGQQLIIFPEGTRSDTGRLQRGKSGAVFLACRSGAPIVPIAHYGGEKLSANVRRLTRTDFHIVVGRPFRVETQGARVTAPVRQQIADEMMFRLAALLPPQYRGEYADLSKAASVYLHDLS